MSNNSNLPPKPPGPPRPPRPPRPQSTDRPEQTPVRNSSNLPPQPQGPQTIDRPSQPPSQNIRQPISPAQPQRSNAKSPISLFSGILSIIFGVLSFWFECFLMFSVILGFAGALLGYLGKKQIDESGGSQSSRKMALFGMILGLVSVFLMIVLMNF